MTERKRIDYLDMAKGIGILLVVIGHVTYVSEPVRQYISTFHMPFFFLISGMLLCYKQEEENSLWNFAVRRFKGLMIPYIICSICIFLIESCRILWKAANTWENVFRQVFQSLCLQGVSVLWFLPALFLAELVFLFLRKKSSHLWTAIFLVSIYLLSSWAIEVAKEYFSQTNSLRADLCYDVISMIFRTLFCVSFVGSGYYFGSFLFAQKSNRIVEMFLSTGLLVFTGVVLKLNGSVDIRGMNLGNPALFLLGGVGGSVGVIVLCRVLESLPLKMLHHFLLFMGCNSLLIMVTHLDFRVLYISILVSEWLNDTLLHNGVLFCISIILCAIFIETVIIWGFRVCRKSLQRKK